MWDLNANWASFFPLLDDNLGSWKSFDFPPLHIDMEIDSINSNVLANFFISDVKIPLIVVKDKHPLRGFVFTSPELHKIFFEGDDYSPKSKK